MLANSASLIFPRGITDDTRLRCPVGLCCGPPGPHGRTVTLYGKSFSDGPSQWGTSLLRSRYCGAPCGKPSLHALVNLCVSPLRSFLGVACANPFSTLSIHGIYMRCDRLVIHTFAVEAIALSMLFMMWLVGTAIATVSISSMPLSCTLTHKCTDHVG